MAHHRRIATLLVALLAGAFMVPPGAATSATAKKRVRPLRVVVTNDDGVAGVGLDVLVEALRDEPKVDVVVVAPAGESSGSGDATSPGPVAAEDAATLSGYEATAVLGTPADSVVYALEELGLKPHLVVSGINATQNFGPGIAVSGTIGAASTAVRRGVPAIAVSQGAAAEADYAAGARWFLKWFRKARAELSKARGGAVELLSMNVPTCLTGKVRGLLEDLPVAALGDYLETAEEVRCESTLTDPPDDSTAFNNGFATLTALPVE